MPDQRVRGGRQRVRLAFDDQRKIEQVSGGCSMPAMEHFLGDDFRRRFHPYALTIDRPFLPGIIEKIGAATKSTSPSSNCSFTQALGSSL